jgi:Flp pilus assembly protein TadG
MKAQTITTRLQRRCIALARACAAEDGSDLVETALSLGILMTFLFGVFEMSLAGYTYHFISEAAREGTRYAMVRGADCTSWATACPAKISDIQAYVTGLNYPGIDSTKMTVNVTLAAYGGTNCPSSGLCDTPGDMVKVQVIYAFPFAVPFVPASTMTMSSTSQMVIAN